MSKKNKSKKKKSNQKKNNKPTKKQQKQKVQNALKEETLKANMIKIKHENRQIKIKNISETIEQLIVSFMRIFCFFAFVLSLMAIFIAIIASIFLYIKQDPIATIVLTILQVLTGIVSLVVGIWALVLTIQANRKNSISQNKLNIVVSSADNIVTQVNEETDVNLSSL